MAVLRESQRNMRTASGTNTQLTSSRATSSLMPPVACPVSSASLAAAAARSAASAEVRSQPQI
jgi:hypothetical protein